MNIKVYLHQHNHERGKMLYKRDALMAGLVINMNNNFHKKLKIKTIIRKKIEISNLI